MDLGRKRFVVKASIEILSNPSDVSVYVTDGIDVSRDKMQRCVTRRTTNGQFYCLHPLFGQHVLIKVESQQQTALRLCEVEINAVGKLFAVPNDCYRKLTT